MKTRLPLLLALTSAVGLPLAGAQDERPPQPPQPPQPPAAPDAVRPPTPPEGEERPGPGRGGPRERRPEGERGPGSPDLERGPGRPDGERGLGRPEGGRRFEGERHNPRGENGGREGGANWDSNRPQKPIPFIGVATSPVPGALGAQLGLPEGFGVLVEEVVPDSPAGKAGVARYDVLKLLNDQQLVDPNQLSALVRSAGKDKEVSLTLLRKGQEQKLTVRVGERMAPERPSPERPSSDWRGSVQLPGGERVPVWKGIPGRVEDYGRKMEEQVREFQQRMRDFQQKVEHWRKDPGNSKMPEPPTFQPRETPNTPVTPPPPEPPRPSDLLREGGPGGAPQVHLDQDGASTTWNTGQARIFLRDDTGEIEVRNEGGKRHVVAKSPTGETVFNGPVDTDEQRQALPERVRKALEKIRMQGSQRPSGAAAEAAARTTPPGRGSREIQ